MSKQVIADLTVLVNDLQAEISMLEASIATLQSQVSTLQAQVALLMAGNPPPPVTGNFGNEWFYQPPGGGATGFVGQVNGVLTTRLANPGGDDNNYGYCTAQRGTFPWGSTEGDALPVNVETVTVSAILLDKSFISGHSHANYYVGLYYSCPVAFNGWFDTQVRVEWIDRVQTVDGVESTYGGPNDPGVQANGYSIAQTSPSFSIDVEAQFTRAATAWNIDPNTPHKLAGIEIGSEGFGTVKLNVNFPSYSLTTGVPPPPPPPAQLSATFITSTGTLPLTEAFTAHATGGTPPYSYNWDFGDTLAGVSDIIQHVYVFPGNYTVTLTVTDAAGAKASFSQSVTISALPPPPPPSTIEQIVMVILENTDISGCLAQPFLGAFAKANALATQWAFDTHPSEPNYLAIAFGDDFGVSGDGVSTKRPAPTILDLVQKSGRTWKVIQNGSRGFDHNAFLLETPVPTGGSFASGDTPAVIAEASKGTNFVWFTPSDNQNAHDNGIADASNWLSTWIPQLLAAMSPNSLLIITTDEDNSFVYTVFAGPGAKKNYTSNNPYNHYSFAKLVGSLWGGNLGRNDVTASNPSEFLA